jgi:hypothetical protein
MSTCTITVSEDKKYVIIKVVGNITSQDIYQHAVEAHELARSLNLRAFLMDLTDSVNLQSASENYDVVYRRFRTSDQLIRNSRLAMWVKADDHSHDFIETLATNAGDNVKLFRDPQKAIQFLVGGSM